MEKNEPQRTPGTLRVLPRAVYVSHTLGGEQPPPALPQV